MKLQMTNDLIFSRKYRLLRHVLFWITCYVGWSLFWTLNYGLFTQNLVWVGVWIPLFILYTYPVSHFAVPWLLLRRKHLLFFGFIIFWFAVGWIAHIYFRDEIFLPQLVQWSMPHTNNPRGPQGLLCMASTVAALSAGIILKHWITTKEEKTVAQLQLLKAQLHPHFLFNTLNNMYGFALNQSDKTPGMILRLSSLLSYMLYECKGEEVLLEKELEVMKDYIDLEKERYGDKLDISVSMSGDIEDKFISPLLILPFLENAFKHGTSEQLGRPWMSVDISVKESLLKCKVVNSKNEHVPYHENGVGIQNVRKRLELIYPGKYDLKLRDDGDFFVVSLMLHLRPIAAAAKPVENIPGNLKKLLHENTVPVS